MRKRLKRAILLLFSALAALLIFVGCDLGMTPEQAKHAYDLEASVTYYANGGEIGSIKSKELWYKANSRPADIAPGASSGTLKALSRDNHDFVGWYHVKLDENGMPIADLETGLCELDYTRPVDFSAILEKDVHWYIGADWKPHKRINVVLVSESSITSKDGVTYNSGDEIATVYYLDGYANLAYDDEPIALSGKDDSFISYYNDAACTELIASDIAETDDLERTIYAKYIDGDWTPLRTDKDVQNMFIRTSMSGNYYLVQDVDMTGRSVTVGAANTGAGVRVINGNGYKISNLVLEAGALGNQCSLFGQIKSGSSIKDITFENVTFDLKLSAKFNASFGIYFVFTSIEDGAVVENVNFNGELSLMIEKSEDVSIANFPQTDGKYDLTNCLFGGFDSDEAYTQNNSNGFKVNGLAQDIVEFI